MFVSPFNDWPSHHSYGGYGVYSPHAVDPYAAQLQREAEMQRRRQAKLARQAELERRAEQQYRAEMKRRYRAEQQAAYERELAERQAILEPQRDDVRMRRGRRPRQLLGYDIFGRPVYRHATEELPDRECHQHHGNLPERQQRSRRYGPSCGATAADAASLYAEKKKRAAEIACQKRMAAAAQLRQRIAAKKIQHWFRTAIEKKYAPDPRIEEVDEGFVIPPHRVLPETSDFVVAQLV